MTDVNIIPVEGEEPPPEDDAELYVGGADSYFSAIMGALESEEPGEEGGEGGGPADAPAGGDGSPAAPAEGAPAAAGDAAAPAEGTAGEPAVPPAGDSGFTRDAAEFNDNWTAALEGLETRQRTELTALVVGEVREEYKSYIEAVEQAPRYLVGKTVPKADGSGEERLADAQDARDWQEEIKKQLAREVNRRVQLSQEENRGTMELLHNSIELFRGNPDIVPGARQFDKELADEFAKLIEPYAVKTNEGKVAGWSIDVKPLLTAARATLTSRRAAAAPPAAAPSPSPQQQRAATQPRNEQQQFTTQQPQAGIPNSAGQSSGDGENLDTLFGTLGFPEGTFRF